MDSSASPSAATDSLAASIASLSQQMAELMQYCEEKLAKMDRAPPHTTSSSATSAASATVSTAPAPATPAASSAASAATSTPIASSTVMPSAAATSAPTLSSAASTTSPTPTPATTPSMEERLAIDAASPLPKEEQLPVDEAATEDGSIDPDAPTRITPATVVSVPIMENALAYQQIQDPKPSPSSYPAMTAKDEADALHQLREREYKYGVMPVDIDRLSLLPDALLGHIVSRLPIKDVARTAVLSRSWSFLCHPLRFVSLVCSDPSLEDELSRITTREAGLTMEHDEEKFETPLDDPGFLCCVHQDLAECVLSAITLGGYDCSLDDDPKSGMAHFDVPLGRAVRRIGQVLAAAAALRPDAVGAAGGGRQPPVVAVGSVQTNCSIQCLGTSIGVLASTRGVSAVPTSSVLSLAALPHAYIDSAGSHDDQGTLILGKLLDMEMLSTADWDAQQPWPPPHMLVELECGCADMRPPPWSSFTMVAHERVIGKCFNLPRKPPCPTPYLSLFQAYAY